RLDSADGCGRNARDFESSTSAAPSNQAAILESQTIHMIQQLIGQTLRRSRIGFLVPPILM
ncbi:MAG TPA: hypothetical protein VIJ42_01225, partial [Stellaceae bacterium]